MRLSAGQLLRKARRLRGLSQCFAAEMMNCSASTFYRYERDSLSPSYQFVVTFVEDICGLDCKELMAMESAAA